MKYRHCFSALALLVASNAYAGKTLWTFEPLTETTFSLPQNSTATVRYRVTNQSSKTHVLSMKPVIGIMQTTTGAGRCSSPFTLAGGASCLLELEVNGSQLQGNVISGPEVYDTGSTFQGYQPTAANSLNITLTNALTVASIEVLNPSLALFKGGRPRILRIKNTSTNIVAHDIFLNFVGTPFEDRVKTVSNTCGEVAAQATCQLLVVPDVSVSQLSIFLGSTSGTATVESEDGDTTAAAVDVVEYSVGDDYPIGSTTTKIGSLDPIDPLLNLIVDASDQSKMRFSSHKAKIAIKSVIDGFENTKAIVDANVQVGYQADYPADECYKRPLLNGEYSFLPALEQLRAVLKNCSIIGQCIEHEDYWTSTEAPSSFDSETYVLRPDEPDRNDEDGWKAENIYRCVYAIADE